MRCVVGIDMSLTGTGIAEVWATGDVAHRVEGSSPPTVATVSTRSARLRGLAGRIIAHASEAELVVVEGPSYGSSGAGTWDRAGLWHLVVASLDAAAVPVVEVPPATLKVYATGKGRADKDVMVASVVRRWGHLAPTLSNNNACDAVALASMGATHLGYPPVELPQDHLRALKAIAWPNTKEN